MTQEDRNWMYATAYRLEGLRRRTCRELLAEIRKSPSAVKGRMVVVMDAEVLEKIADRIRHITERDGEKLITGA